MTDREMLEFAYAAYRPGENYTRLVNDAGSDYWNPLTDDGDALRLAVRLGISVLQFPACIGTKWPQNGLPARLIGFDPPHEEISSGQDVLAATRRAITRAAAEIGRNMK
jgi:hypothetical protein